MARKRFCIFRFLASAAPLVSLVLAAPNDEENMLKAVGGGLDCFPR